MLNEPTCDCFDRVSRWFEEFGPLRADKQPPPKLCDKCKKAAERAEVNPR